MYPLTSRRELRENLRQKRQQLDFEFRNAVSKEIIKELVLLPIFRTSLKIALYLPYDFEADISSLISVYPKKEYYLPILMPSKDLKFGLYHAETKLKPNLYGILEPITQQVTTPDKLDLVCTPLVGFDEQGNRLGMGGGYYDRTFNFKTNEIQQPFLLGIAYDCQKIEHLEAAQWDIPLNGVLTEMKFYNFTE